MSRPKSSSVVRSLKQNLQEVEQQAHNLFELIARDPSLKDASLPSNNTQGDFDMPSNASALDASTSFANAASALAANGSSFSTSTTTSSTANGTTTTSITNLFITAAASAAATANGGTPSAAIAATTSGGGMASSFLGLLRTHVTDSIHQANESIDCLAKMDEITEVHQPTIENVRKLVDTIQEQVSQLSHCYLMSKSTTSSMQSFPSARVDAVSTHKNKDALSLYQMSTLQFAEESMNLLTAKILDDDSVLKPPSVDVSKPVWAMPEPPPQPIPRNRKALVEQRKFVLNRLKDQSGSMDRQLESMLTTQTEVLKRVIDATKD